MQHKRAVLLAHVAVLLFFAFESHIASAATITPLQNVAKASSSLSSLTPIEGATSFLSTQTTTQTGGWIAHLVARMSVPNGTVLGGNYKAVGLYILLTWIASLLLTILFVFLTNRSIFIVGLDSFQNVYKVIFQWLSLSFSITSLVLFIVPVVERRLRRPRPYISDSAIPKQEAADIAKPYTIQDITWMINNDAGSNRRFQSQNFSQWIDPQSDKTMPDPLRILVRHFHPDTLHVSEDVRSKAAKASDLVQVGAEDNSAAAAAAGNDNPRARGLALVYAFRQTNGNVPPDMASNLTALVDLCQTRLKRTLEYRAKDQGVQTMMLDARIWGGFFISCAILLNNIASMFPELAPVCPVLPKTSAGIIKYSADLSQRDLYPNLSYQAGWSCKGSSCSLGCEAGYSATGGSTTCTMTVQGVYWSHLRTDSPDPSACCIGTPHARSLREFKFNVTGTNATGVIGNATWTQPQQFTTSCGKKQRFWLQLCPVDDAHQDVFLAFCDTLCGGSTQVAPFAPVDACPAFVKATSSPLWTDPLRSLANSTYDVPAGTPVVDGFTVGSQGRYAARLLFEPSSSAVVVGPWQI